MFNSTGAPPSILGPTLSVSSNGEILAVGYIGQQQFQFMVANDKADPGNMTTHAGRYTSPGSAPTTCPAAIAPCLRRR